MLSDLRARFDQVLAELESVAGWTTARVQRPVMILGNLDGIETGVRQLIRDEPLETTQIECRGEALPVPTQVRKGWRQTRSISLSCRYGKYNVKMVLELPDPPDVRGESSREAIGVRA